MAVAAASNGFEDNGNANWEIELLASDMETRLRSAMLRLLRPALDQVTDISKRFSDLQDQVSRHDEIIAEVEEQKEVIAQHSEVTNMVADQLREVESQSRNLERRNATDFTGVRVVCTDFEKRIEEQSVELRKLSRQMERTWDESKNSQDHLDGTTKKLWDGIAIASKKTDTVRDECIDHITTLQRQREQLMEELYGQGSGLNKLSRDFAGLVQFTLPIPDVQKEQANLWDRLLALEKSQEDVQKITQTNLQRVDLVHAEFDQTVAVVREDMKSQGNSMVSHHASLMMDIRKEYAIEMNEFRQLRMHIAGLENHTERHCLKLAEQLQSQSRRLDSIHNELSHDMEDQKRKRKKERMIMELELNDLKQHVSGVQSGSKDLRCNLEFFGKITGLILEGERVTNAMLIQDFADRAADKWLALPSDVRVQSDPVSSDMLLHRRQRHNLKQSEIVPVDWRKGLLRAQYLPGQVSFKGQAFERCDLLLLHERLLQKAHSAFVKGPGQPELTGAASILTGASGPEVPSTSPVAAVLSHSRSEDEGSKHVSPVTFQPSARGGTAAEDVSGQRAHDAQKIIDECKMAASTRNVGSRQRPGSQGQPEAIGSRGTESDRGSRFSVLGETPPPVPSSRASARGSGNGLRLPPIIGDSQSSLDGAHVTQPPGVGMSTVISKGSGSLEGSLTAR